MEKSSENNVIASEVKQSSKTSPKDSGLLRHSVPSNDKFSDLRLRIVTGLAFAALAGGALYLGDWVWTAFIAICGVEMFIEWNRLTKMRSIWFRLLGLPYVLTPCAALIGLYYAQNKDPHFLLWLVATVAATDIGAYFAGRLIGGKKLAPVLSPNKTWAGLIGGVIAATTTLGALLYVEYHDIVGGSTLVIGALTALVAQAGDIFESSLKRTAGVKDAGTILPGHGGLLDRVDGLLFAAVFWICLIWWMN